MRSFNSSPIHVLVAHAAAQHGVQATGPLCSLRSRFDPAPDASR